tara:strand:- start:7600 stop:8868 length:1269 start_codon:yes stop_codon:yes gene_type:complete
LKKNIKLSEKNQNIVRNFSALTLIQALNYLFPLILVPYVVRIINADKFGLITYYNEILVYFIILVNFGFEFTATRQLALNIDNKEKTRKIFWETSFVRTILLIVSVVSIIIISTLIQDQANHILYLIIFAKILGLAFLPTWFLNGIEKNNITILFLFFTRLISAIYIFLYLENESQYLIYPIALTIAEIIMGISLFIYIIKKFDLGKIHYPKMKNIIIIFKENFFIFLNIVSNQYVTLNFFILGFFVSDQMLGYYSGAFKIIMPIMIITWLPLNQSMYPIMNRAFKEDFKKGVYTFKKNLKPIIIFNLFLSISIYFTAPLLVKIVLGNGFDRSIEILKIFSLLPIFVTLTNYFTIQGLYVMKLENIAPYIGVSIGLLCIISNLLFTNIFGIKAAAYIWVLCQILAVIITGYILNIKMKKYIK